MNEIASVSLKTQKHKKLIHLSMFVITGFVTCTYLGVS